MVSCCVEGCEAKDVVYFKLPNSKTKCKKWLETIKLSHKPSYNSMVCSAHFRPEDYGVVRGKVRLKPKVLPIPQSETQKLAQITRRGRRKSANMDRSDNGAGETDLNEMETPKESVKLANGGMEEENTDLNIGEVTDENQKRELDVNSSKSVLTENTANNYAEPKPNNGTASDKDDIEDILTHYCIKQNKEIAKRQTKELAQETPAGWLDGAKEDGRRSCEVIDLSLQKDESQPVIIEVAVDQGPQDAENSGARDCLMLLESVQVELDPNDLMLSDREDEKKQSEPISLLTSSDEDDVILQEPRVETVVVSDASDGEDAAGGKDAAGGEDEEDVPLVRLVTLRPRPRKRAPNPFYKKNGLYKYYCLQCPYRTTKKAEYLEHMVTHSTIILICPKCGYSTSSKAQYTRHKRKHQAKRRFQCHLCEYKARHRMTLVYHLKCHESVSDKNSEFKCDKCGYVTKLKRYLVRHVRLCGALKYACSLCAYRSKRSFDLKRHEARRHCAHGSVATTV